MIKQTVANIIQQEKINIEKEVSAVNFKKSVEQLAEDSTIKLSKFIADETAKLYEEISHYSVCGSCSKCERIKHRKLLTDKQDGFKEVI